MRYGLPSLVAAAVFSAGVQAGPLVDSSTSDQVTIYAKFLDHWVGHKKAPTNVASIAKPPTAEDLSVLADCLRETKLSIVPTVSVQLASTRLARRKDIRLIDPTEWHPLDPRDLIEKGHRIGEAVGEGMAAGLLTLSAIVFDDPHKVAVFTYDFACGSLCGNGSRVIFDKRSTGWVQRTETCGNWIS